MTEARTTDALAAVEALFGAGVTVAPMQGATLFRFLPALEDPWSGGLHLDQAPDADALRRWLSTWDAFDRPGRLRWVEPPGSQVAAELRTVVAEAGLDVTSRLVSMHRQGDVAHAGPADVSVREILGDAYDWAGFEVLARWIDDDADAARWRWRAKRLRHLVEGGRGRAWLARTDAMPVGAQVQVRTGEHRSSDRPTVVSVVHGAHRGRGIGAALLAATEPTRSVHVLGAAATVGVPLATLIEVGPPTRAATVRN